MTRVGRVKLDWSGQLGVCRGEETHQTSARPEFADSEIMKLMRAGQSGDRGRLLGPAESPRSSLIIISTGRDDGTFLVARDRIRLSN